MKITRRQLRNIISEVCGGRPEGEVYGHGGKARMAKSQLYQIVKGATELHDMLNDDDELPEWVQSKIAVIEDNIDTIIGHLEYKVRDHLGGEELGVHPPDCGCHSCMGE
jgi:hypothetical protein